MATVNVLVLGDSNSEQSGAQIGGVAANVWSARLLVSLRAAYPSTTFTMRNSAVGGTGTWYTLANLNTLCLQYSPDVVLIALGTNNVGTTNGTYQAELTSIIAQIHALTYIAHDGNPRGYPLVVAMQPPVAAPGDPERYITGSAIAGYYINGRTRTFVGSSVPTLDGILTIKDATALCGADATVTVYDQLAAIGWTGVSNTYTPNLTDGVHLSSAAHSLVAGYVMATLAPALTATGTVPLGYATYTDYTATAALVAPTVATYTDYTAQASVAALATWTDFDALAALVEVVASGDEVPMYLADVVNARLMLSTIENAQLSIAENENARLYLAEV